MQETLLKIGCFERISKTFKKLTWFFLLHSVPFYVQDYEKLFKASVSSYQSFFKLQNMFWKIYFHVIYYLDNIDDLIPRCF